jgi:S-adenosylmethionine/arginine decarboxylase-like enzyme
MKEYSKFIDLAPPIVRRRLVVECIHKNNFNEQKIYDYMVELSNIMNMTIVTRPVTNYVDEYGYSAYMSWKESGMHVYTWNETSERPNFMSIDIYTCKNFEISDVINFTKNTFKDEITEITWRE